MTIYADNAATTKPSRAALDAMIDCLENNYGNPSSLYSLGFKAAETIESARTTISGILGCRRDEIYFTSGGSESDNQSIVSAALAGKRKGKTHIISSAFEHHAVLHTLNKLKAQGYDVTLLDVHENGIVSPQQVADAIRPETCLVTIMYANNEIGTIQPIAEIGAVCKERGVLFHTDAVQAVGHVKIDVAEQNIDMLSLSAHKFHGPKGIGALYVKKGVPLTNLIEGGAQERGKRAGTENVPAIAGMAAALTEAADNIDKNAAYLTTLRNMLIEGLSHIPHSILNGDREIRLPNNVNMCFERSEGDSFRLLLNEQGICASSGSACTSGSLDPSHVLLAIGRPHEIAHGSLRLTLSPSNTKEEISAIIAAVTQIVADLRAMSPVWRDLQEGKRTYVIH
jgi:cysteine desulfurase